MSSINSIDVAKLYQYFKEQKEVVLNNLNDLFLTNPNLENLRCQNLINHIQKMIKNNIKTHKKRSLKKILNEDYDNSNLDIIEFIFLEIIGFDKNFIHLEPKYQSFIFGICLKIFHPYLKPFLSKGMFNEKEIIDNLLEMANKNNASELEKLFKRFLIKLKNFNEEKEIISPANLLIKNTLENDQIKFKRSTIDFLNKISEKVKEDRTLLKTQIIFYLDRYKDLIEGFFNYLLNFIGYLLAIVKNKSFDYKTYENYSALKKIKTIIRCHKKFLFLYKIYNKHLRNSVAHKRYKILIKRQKIIIIDINLRTKKKYRNFISFEKFSQFFLEFYETIYSIKRRFILFYYLNYVFTDFEFLLT